MRKANPKGEPALERITAGLQAALEQAEDEGRPVAEIAKAAAQGEEVTTELNGQKLTITARELGNMEGTFNVTGERRKALEWAEKYTKGVVKCKEQYPSLVAECYRISTDDLVHMDMLHKQAMDMIEGKKRDGREVPASMQAIWDWKHEKMMDETADVKRLLEMYKG